MNNAPRVTVFIPAYNAAQFVGQAIESVLAQTFVDFELLIVDDGSTDDTESVLARYAEDPRIRVIVNPQNLGRPRTRNVGLDETRGEYLALLDADDHCAPDRLAVQVNYLDHHSDIALLGSIVAFSDEQGKPQLVDRRRRQVFKPEEIAVEMLFSCPILQPTVMARTAILRRYRYDPEFGVAQDYELFIRLAASHRLAVLPEPLTWYRQHSAQATAAEAVDVRAARHHLQAKQLRALGVQFCDNDVIRHDHLFKFKGRRLFKEQSGQVLDLEFVRWSRQWMETLARANASSNRYPEPTFTHMLGMRWLFICRKAAGHNKASGLDVWAEFFRSPLLKLAIKALVAGKLRRY